MKKKTLSLKTILNIVEAVLHVTLSILLIKSLKDDFE